MMKCYIHSQNKYVMMKCYIHSQNLLIDNIVLKYVKSNFLFKIFRARKNTMY